MLHLPDPLVEAARIVRRSPGRSSLTVLGLAIGIAAFIAMVSFGEGARRSVVAQFQPLGINVLRITMIPGVRQAGGRPAQPLSSTDVAAIQRDATTAARVLPVYRRQADVALAGKYRWTTVYGTLADFVPVHDWTLSVGGVFDDADIRTRAQVCVLGATPARELFGEEEAVGRTVTVGGLLPCRVIGVLEAKGHNTAGSDLDDIVLLPLKTYSDYLGGGEGYGFIEVEPLTFDLLEPSREEVHDIVRRTHGIGASELDDFTVSSPREVVRAVDRTSRILGGLLTGIAALSLIVGGIGIMNIQLVSVAERTEEIGIRSAIGASPRQIMNQFLLEAGLLSLVGALSGIALGVGAASIVASQMAWPRVISGFGVLGSVGFGVGIGVLFGYLPALRAARLDPIQALRHE
jgi:putative ABC transport system permease protein